MARILVSALFFDDLAPGDEWESPARTITEADVVAFAGISGDFNPIHVDHESGRAGPFGGPIAHGLLGLAISSGLTSNHPRIETLAFLEIESYRFVAPIAFGDTIRVITRVESIQPRARNRRAVVTWRRTLVNQRGETVQEGTTRTLVRGRAGIDPSNGPEAVEG